ncbi:hypothetical protein SAMN04488515_2042 [Cognatiyoonia koreensis]|uniref:Lipoprotein n=1 Tax=Cognatiyoonia koreensis TaxID=364200 RepID=A0A1I0QNS0_9RHOB|nr:hypothetical protein [Cognatiyoonia koreensis]SEW28793.1 hypothetical protein SAMN04488515_2042 [Cognatiyoonia koreensis]
MLKSKLGLLAVILTLAGCNTLNSEAETREVLIGDCQNGAFLNQATFGGPVRCGPQAEPVFTPAPAPEQN